LNIYVVCTTCTTTDHGRAGHEFVSLNDAGNDWINFLFPNISITKKGSHQVAKLQHMVENTRQRLIELKHSQKTVDRSYNSLQVK
jgi:hypothetical protein